MTGSRSDIPEQAMQVLHFWFLELRPADWFDSSERLDSRIERRFGPVLSDAVAGRLDDWADTPQGLLALVIVLDQFSRNIHRGTARAFAQDKAAQGLVLRALDAGWDDRLGMDERQFLYMPLMHAEDRDLQELAVGKYEALVGSAQYVLDFAKRHRDIVQDYGRFPYRNEMLKRESTAEEREFIEEKGNPFA